MNTIQSNLICFFNEFFKFEILINKDKIKIKINRNNNVVTVGVVNKSDIPNKVVLDFSKDNSVKLSSNRNKIEKVLFYIIYLLYFNFSKLNIKFI